MTVHRLSARSVKVILSAEELQFFVTEPDAAPDSPQMMRLLAVMLAQAERVSGIPFSQMPVTVELLRAQNGSLAVYFTAHSDQPEKPKRSRRDPVRLAARFADKEALRECCGQLRAHAETVRSSILCRYRGAFVLSLGLRRSGAQTVHHILMEYGRPYRLSAIGRARLTEYGECIYDRDAVTRILSSRQSESPMDL